MYLALVFTGLVCAVFGSLFNYVGVELMRCAFEHIGGDAIGLFFGGLLITILSLIFFVMFSMCGKIFINSIKDHLEGE